MTLVSAQETDLPETETLLFLVTIRNLTLPPAEKGGAVQKKSPQR